jgi:hypothetical protein
MVERDAPGPLPQARAASTYSRAHTALADARVMRANRDVEDADGDDGVDDARPEDGGQHDGRQQAGKAKVKSAAA